MEEAIGNEEKLIATAIGKKIQQIAQSSNLDEKERAVKMACAKAVIFDYIGTLVNCRGYTMDASKEKLYRALVAEGFDVDREKFIAGLRLWRMRNTAKSAMSNYGK